MISEFEVKGMRCRNCVAHVVKAVQGLAGVRTVRVSLEGRLAVVDYDETAVRPESIVKAIDEDGYEARLAV